MQDWRLSPLGHPALLYRVGKSISLNSHKKSCCVTLYKNLNYASSSQMRILASSWNCSQRIKVYKNVYEIYERSRASECKGLKKVQNHYINWPLYEYKYKNMKLWEPFLKPLMLQMKRFLEYRRVWSYTCLWHLKKWKIKNCFCRPISLCEMRCFKIF